MNKPLKAHCSVCGELMHYAETEEGRTVNCPKCNNPVWLSHLVEDAAPMTHPPASGTRQGKHPFEHRTSLPLAHGLLLVLLISNIVLGYGFFGLKQQVQDLVQSQDTFHWNPPQTIASQPSNSVMRAAANRALDRAMTNQEMVDMLIEAVAMLDEDMQTQLTAFREETASQTARIESWTRISSEWNTALDEIYQDVSTIASNLEALSLDLSEVQNNQLLIQQVLDPAE